MSETPWADGTEDSPFRRVCDCLDKMLTDPDANVGSSVEWTGGFLVMGNRWQGAPPLSPAFIDDFGRIWIERRTEHTIGLGPQQGESSIRCIFDLRTIGYSPDAEAS